MSITPFDDAPALVVKPLTSGSNPPIDTSAFDDWRQGVELTQEKYYFHGSIVKIHSGEPNHLMAVLNYGGADVNILDVTSFNDTDKYDPLYHLMTTDLNYFPPPFNDDINLIGFNGTIEPLTIRDIVAFASLYGKYEPHAFHGNLESGNHSLYNNSDVQKLEYERKEQQARLPYTDYVATMGNLKLDALESIPIINDVPPFDDSQPPSAVFSNVKDDPNLRATVWYNLNPASDTYVPNNKVSTTKGYTWSTFDGSNADSIAFGDLRYTYR
jgi:hypothetical protein